MNMSSGYIEPYKTYKGYIIAPGITMPSYNIYEYDIFENFGQYEEHNPIHASESELEAEQWVDKRIELREGEKHRKKHNMEIERRAGYVTRVGPIVVKTVMLPDWTLDFIEYPEGSMAEYRDELMGQKVKIVKVTKERIYFEQGG